jgi:glycosyltransferase involved in cell wall biosynthesis
MNIAHVYANTQLESRGIKFVNYSKKNRIGIKEYLKNKDESYSKFFFKTIKGILGENIDVIHAHRISGYLPAMFIKILKPSIKIIYDKHDIHKYDFIFDRLMFFSDYALTASELHLEHVLKFKKKSKVIPNYADFKPVSNYIQNKVRKEAGLKKGEILLLFQGSIVRDYGLDLLLNALPMIDKKVKLVIIGWIKEPDYWESIKKDLTERVVYLGAKKYTEMNDSVGSADIGVVLFQKSKLTLFGNPAKLFEFINCKVPIIATDIECVSKYIRKYGNGIVVDNKEELASAANKLVDRKAREKYSKKSPDLQFEKEFNEKYLTILKEFEDE